MNCPQCQGIEELFNPQYVDRELSHYRTKGPSKTTRIFIEAVKESGVDGVSLLDIGGGVGAIQHELLAAGIVERAASVEASAAYLAAAKAEAQRRGEAGRVSFHHGNFVDLAAEIEPADIVTLDRVICCYHDMEKLVNRSAAKARKLYGLVYPRDTWWVKLGLALQNFFFRLIRSPFRTFAHPSKQVEAILGSHELKRHFYRRTLVWQIIVFKRE